MVNEERILFCDRQVLALNKRGGELSQPTDKEPFSALEIAKEWLITTEKKTNTPYLHPIHRLDRPVSGILVFARTSKALSRLNESIREKKSKKVYRALVEGVIKGESTQTWTHFLIHGDHRAEIGLEGDKEAKKSLLGFKVLEHKKNTTFVEIFLETGRYHQIRAQFAAMDHPILGDFKYGSKREWQNPEEIALHHFRFEIPHPISQEMLLFEAPLPETFTTYFN